MKRAIIALVLAAGIASAQPWLSPEGKLKYKLPSHVINADGMLSVQPTWERLQSLGWAEAERMDTAIISTNPISDEVKLAMFVYQTLIEQMFGPGSHTNAAIDRGDVLLTLASDPAYFQYISLMRDSEEVLSQFHGGHFSTLPYGQTSVIVTNINTEWRAKDEE